MPYGAFAAAAREIAREAGATLRAGLLQPRQVSRKTSANDLVTEMDRAVEAFVVDALHRRFPAHAVRGEEGARSAADDWEYRWHVDPLDGTINYLHRYPWFAVSLGLERRGTLVAGAVYNVIPDEMFWAARGAGAWRDETPIHVTEARRLEDSLLATGFPYWIREDTGTVLASLDRFLRVAHGVRRAGAASLDLAYVAAGQLDGYWEQGVQTWDVAAGALLVREAGGRVTDWDGAAVEMPTAHIVASNGALHDAMVAQLRGQYR